MKNTIIGYLEVEVEGYFIERFINICTEQKIFIWNLRREKGIKLYFNIGIKDFKKISTICKKTKCKVKIQKKKGIPFIIHRYKKRKIFLIFLVIMIISIIISSQYIWNIEIKIEDNQQLESLENDLREAGLKKGILKKKIDTNQLISEIMIKRNDISWMGIDIKGTNAIIKVAKMTEKPEIIDNDDICNIVATKNGTIESVIAQNGTPLVKKGDIVHPGDILIAGYIEGKHTGKRMVHSMGEVKAKIIYEESKKIPYTQEILRETGEEEKKYQIKFNNFQINFYKTLSKFKIYDTIYTEQNLKIFSNLYLPISVGKIINKEKEKVTITYTKEEAKEIAVEQLRKKIESQIENNIEIIRKFNKSK